MGALIKQDRGRYKVHPALMWRGQLMRRGKLEEGNAYFDPGRRREGGLVFPKFLLIIVCEFASYAHVT